VITPTVYSSYQVLTVLSQYKWKWAKFLHSLIAALCSFYRTVALVYCIVYFIVACVSVFVLYCMVLYGIVPKLYSACMQSDAYLSYYRSPLLCMLLYCPVWIRCLWVSIRIHQFHVLYCSFSRSFSPSIHSGFPFFLYYINQITKTIPNSDRWTDGCDM